ncbi:MAG: DegT/DnrJ/EryC1/StrS family aminotransferase [Caulobacteraceae bacterium]|nr:DegT/DnrJ/EryC1/StrS family aminotransferase [Caulobacteraceae bacterium]
MIPITQPQLGEAEAEAAARVVRSGWLSQGPEVAAFEAEFAQMVGAPHACAVSNCTTALHLALTALGIGPGDEVITASHSFIATANVIRQTGATPVFADIELGGFNLDPDAVSRAITPRTRAVLAVHQIGMPCDLGAILPIARAHGLRVIEDAACAAGAQIRLGDQWSAIGSPHADIACFSFHPRKVITTGEGGMLTTRDPQLDATFRLLRQHGMSVPDTVRHAAREVVLESYPVSGFNYRMSDLQAAVGRVQLAALPQIVARRRELAGSYRRKLADIDGLTPPAEPDWARSNWQSYCVRLPQGARQIEVMQSMLDSGVATRRGIMCAHLEPAYAGLRTAPLPRSEAAHRECILLPLFPQMTEAMQDEVAFALHAALHASHGLSAVRALSRELVR